MSKVPTDTRVDTPGRVLIQADRPRYNSAAIRVRLTELRPACRTYLIHEWRERIDGAPWLMLYLQLFGELPAWRRDTVWSVWCVCEELANRVHHEMFPINYDLMNDCGSCGENPLENPVMFQGHGVPWECLPVFQLSEYLRPLVAIYGLSTACADACAPLAWDEMLSDWWDQLPHDRIDSTDPGGFIWPGTPDGIKAMTGRLETLDPPLDGLATLLRCVVKQTGNPFLDMAEGDQCGEYCDGYFDDYYVPWCREDLNRLTEAWLKAKPEVDRMLAFCRWFNSGPLAKPMIEATNLLIQHGTAVDQELQTGHRGGKSSP